MVLNNHSIFQFATYVDNLKYKDKLVIYQINISTLKWRHDRVVVDFRSGNHEIKMTRKPLAPALISLMVRSIQWIGHMSLKFTLEVELYKGHCIVLGGKFNSVIWIFVLEQSGQDTWIDKFEVIRIKRTNTMGKLSKMMWLFSG